MQAITSHVTDIILEGDLTFDTVQSLGSRYQSVFSNQQAISIQLSRVSRCDSAGLALLVGWVREAKLNHLSIHLVKPPIQLFLLAKLCGLERLLPFRNEITCYQTQ